MQSKFQYITFPLKCILFLALSLFLATQAFSADKTRPKNKATHNIPSDSWSFGQSSARKDSLWKSGIDCTEIRKRSIPHPDKKVVDTRGGIDKAVSKAMQSKNKSSLGLSMESESSRWKVDPASNSLRPDEDMVRDKKHVVRAFADVQASDDLNISVGPELILKDDYYGETSAKSEEPESALGVGMKFKYDF